MSKCVNAKSSHTEFHAHVCKLCSLCYVCHECPDVNPLNSFKKKSNAIKTKKRRIPNVASLKVKDIDNLIEAEKEPRYIFVGPNNEVQDKSSIYLNQDQDSESDVESEAEAESPQNLTCTECDKTFDSQHDLYVHNIYHSNEGAHICEYCFLTFAYSYELIKHKINHKFPCFFCPYCRKEFPSEEKCRLHTRKHTKEKLFFCDVCEKSFMEKQALRNHVMIHTDERPFTCEECGRSFRSKFYLGRHNWIHQGIKPFVCHVCHKTFRHKCNLRSHLKKHPFLDNEDED